MDSFTRGYTEYTLRGGYEFLVQNSISQVQKICQAQVLSLSAYHTKKIPGGHQEEGPGEDHHDCEDHYQYSLMHNYKIVIMELGVLDPKTHVRIGGILSKKMKF